MKTLLIFCSLLFVLSCNQKTKSTIVETKPELAIPDSLASDSSDLISKIDTTQKLISTESPDDEEQLIVILEFEKTACFGKCPSFKVELLSNGVIHYEGRAHVENIGKYISNVNDSFIYTIFQEADKVGFYDLKREYPVDGRQIPDLPKTITYIKNGEKEQQIINGFDSPHELKEFELFIWEKIENLYWEKVQ